MRVGLAAEAADAASRIVKTTLEPMLSEPANAFNNDVRFRAAFDEALETKRVVEALQMGLRVDTEQLRVGHVCLRLTQLQQAAKLSCPLAARRIQ